MTKLLHIITITTVAVLLAIASAAAEKDTAQVAAIRSMHAALVTGKYADFYRDWCHPHLREQLTVEEFDKWMASEKGKAILKLYADVIRAIDTKAGPDVLISRAQDKPDQYEFILVALRKTSASDRAGAQWHLELQLHEGKWKLMDTD
jgi:hypothetical protein